MRKLLSARRPSLSTAVALTALFIALGGSGYAASTLVRATSARLTWHALTLQHGWTTYSATSYGKPAYTKDAQGFVHLRGAVNRNGSGATTFAKLPRAFRPKKGMWLPVGSTNGAGDPQLVNIGVYPDGTIVVYNAPGATDVFVSLAGVTYPTG